MVQSIHDWFMEVIYFVIFNKMAGYWSVTVVYNENKRYKLNVNAFAIAFNMTKNHRFNHGMSSGRDYILAQL